MAELPVLVNKEIINLAYQLYKFFRDIRHNYLEEIEKELAEFIVYMVNYKLKPT